MIIDTSLPKKKEICEKFCKKFGMKILPLQNAFSSVGC